MRLTSKNIYYTLPLHVQTLARLLQVIEFNHSLLAFWLAKGVVNDKMLRSIQIDSVLPTVRERCVLWY